MESFGIPEADASYSALVDTVRDNNTQLQKVALALAQPLAQQITDNEVQLAKVKGALGRSISSRIRANGKQLDKVGLALAQDLVSTAANASTQLAQANIPLAEKPIPDPGVPGWYCMLLGWTGTCNHWSIIGNCIVQWPNDAPPGMTWEQFKAQVNTGPFPDFGQAIASCTPPKKDHQPPPPPDQNLFDIISQCLLGHCIPANSTHEQVVAYVKSWCPGYDVFYQGEGVGSYGVTIGGQNFVVPVCPPDHHEPPPPPSIWKCWRNEQTNVTVVSAVQLDPPWVLQSGPYQTEEEATANCQQPPPPTQEQWYCYHNTESGLTAPSQTDPGSPWILISGPYPDEKTALQNCTTQCPSIPTPSGPTCWEPLELPPVSCGEWNVVGSPEFCAKIPDLIEFASAVGNGILKYVRDTIAGVSDAIQPLDASWWVSLSGIVGGMGELLARIYNNIICIPKVMLKAYLKDWEWLMNLKGCFLPKGSESAVGIWVLRVIIRALENTRIGTDAGVWLTIDLKVELPGLVKILDYLSDYICQQEIPSIADAVDCYLKGTAPIEVVRCWIQLHGGNWDIWFQVIQSRRERLDARELIEYARRQGWNDDVVETELRTLGYTLPEDRLRRKVLYDRLPSVSDILHWQQRNVFDDAYVRDYRLMEGFDEAFYPKFGGILYSQGMKKEYAALHYAAHWINPAPGQLLEMVYRLRPGKPGVQNPFTISDYQRILAEQDVSPFFRPRFAEIANKIPALGYIRDMYHWGVIDDTQLQSYHQDLGYSESDSINFVKVDKINRARQLATSGHGWTPAALGQAWSVRAISQEFLIDRMLEQGYSGEMAQDTMDRADTELQRTVLIRARSRLLMQTTTQVRNAVKVGVMEVGQAAQTLQSLGWPQSFAHGIAQIDAASANVDRIKTTVNTIRGAFLRGEVNQVFAAQSLAQLGIVPTAIQSYIANWSIQQTPNRKRRTASQIVADVASGNITIADGLYRLDNLGYNEADRMLFMADAKAKVIKLEASKAAAELKAGRAKEAELAKLQRLAERQAKQLLTALKKQAPVSKLVQWAKLGLIGHDTFTSRMRLYGYNDDSIRLQWEAACAAKNAACVEQTPPSKGP
jgi:hypothetical protein